MQQCQRDRADGHPERDAIRVDDAAQHAPAEVVHAEGLAERRPAQGVVLGDRGRAAGQNDGGAERREDEGADETQSGQGDALRAGRPPPQGRARHRRRTRGSMTP